MTKENGGEKSSSIKIVLHRSVQRLGAGCTARWARRTQPTLLHSAFHIVLSKILKNLKVRGGEEKESIARPVGLVDQTSDTGPLASLVTHPGREQEEDPVGRSVSFSVSDPETVRFISHVPRWDYAPVRPSFKTAWVGKNSGWACTTLRRNGTSTWAAHSQPPLLAVLTFHFWLCRQVTL